MLPYIYLTKKWFGCKAKVIRDLLAEIFMCSGKRRKYLVLWNRKRFGISLPKKVLQSISLKVMCSPGPYLLKKAQVGFTIQNTMKAHMGFKV